MVSTICWYTFFTPDIVGRARACGGLAKLGLADCEGKFAPLAGAVRAAPRWAGQGDGLPCFRGEFWGVGNPLTSSGRARGGPWPL